MSEKSSWLIFASTVRLVEMSVAMEEFGADEVAGPGENRRDDALERRADGHLVDLAVEHLERVFIRGHGLRVRDLFQRQFLLVWRTSRRCLSSSACG